MKKLIVLIVFLSATFGLKAQNQEAYMKAMTKGLQGMGTAQSIEDLQDIAGQFERISQIATKDWYAKYYTALAYTRMSFKAEGITKKDEYSGKALGLVKEAHELSPNNSEIKALEGMIYTAQLAADPNSRGQMLSGKSMQTLGEALRLNPNNPRAQVLMAQMKFGTAQFFGSPTEDACEMGRKSLDSFAKEEKGKSFNPTWGKEIADKFIEGCEK